MTVQVDVALVPGEMPAVDGAGSLAVMIDVLRASTTMVTALGNGAREIVPLKDLDEARSRHNREPEFLLGGERNANPPPGFDLGNSPLEYTREKVGGRGIIMTTTNGTAALEAARLQGAGTICVGAFVNREAVVEFCLANDLPILLVCAGTKGRFSLEDALCAGAIIQGLGPGAMLTDSANICLRLYQGVDSGNLREAVLQSRHGQYLMDIGYSEDVGIASQLDVSSVVPVYLEGRITQKA